MRTIKAGSGQSLFDIATQETGALQGVLKIAIRNNLSVTGTLEAGGELLIAPEDTVSPSVVARLATYAARSGTALSTQDERLLPEGGVGYMGIGVDFIVS